MQTIELLAMHLVGIDQYRLRGIEPVFTPPECDIGALTPLTHSVEQGCDLRSTAARHTDPNGVEQENFGGLNRF